MSPRPSVVGEVACHSNATLSSSACLGSISHDVAELKEHNYMGLSDSTSDSSTISNISKENSCGLSLKANELGSNLKATELSLGLPGSQSPERYPEHCQLNTTKPDEELLFPVLNSNCPSPQKTVVSGQKRGFSVAMIEFSERKYAANSEVSAISPTGNTADLSAKTVTGKIDRVAHLTKMKESVLRLVSQEQTCAANKSGANHAGASNDSGAPPAKSQVVGWPPIRSFRKSTLAATMKNTNEEEEKAKISRAPYVKVSMDGAPYLRKVDLGSYSAYQDLASGLEKMFSCFTVGKYGSHGAAGKEMPSESKLEDLLHGCEYVLTYEDKDDDLML